MSSDSIFQEFYREQKLVDRYLKEKDRAVDVIIPIFNTNDLWKSNLLSIYREIPVNRLLIGDGGSTDDSLDILSGFPRVEVIDQTGFQTLGYCLKDLIKRAKTEHFVYMHADVFLPVKWFDKMYAQRKEYDWFECDRRMSVLFDYPLDKQNQAERAYSGSQMGSTRFVQQAVPAIDDDYLYRNEDIVIMELVKAAGGRYGRVAETYHHHQVMNKKGEKNPVIEFVNIKKESNPKKEIPMLEMQYRGVVKYLSPKPYLNPVLNLSLQALDDLGALDWSGTIDWIKKTNPEWLKYIKNPRRMTRRIVKLVRRLLGRS